MNNDSGSNGRYQLFVVAMMHEVNDVQIDGDGSAGKAIIET